MEFALQGSLNITGTLHLLLLHLFLKRIEEGLPNSYRKWKIGNQGVKKKVVWQGELCAKFVFELPGSQREEGVRVTISALLLEITPWGHGLETG